MQALTMNSLSRPDRAARAGIKTSRTVVTGNPVLLAHRRPAVALRPSRGAAQIVAFKQAEMEGYGDPTFLNESRAAKESGLQAQAVFRNLSPGALYAKALEVEPDLTTIVSTGALATLSGNKTGRSPKDKRVVREVDSEAEVWWGAGSPNYELDERTFLENREEAINFLNATEQLFVMDGFVNWDTKYRVKIRVVTTRPYHALFMHNMLIRPTEKELKSFGEPDFVIYNAGHLKANKFHNYMTSRTSVDLSLAHKELVILGSEYAGEMKKGVFTYMHYLAPKLGLVSLHSGCNIGKDNDVTLFFGLSGTGKTTLSADPERPLIGDDEHCWGDNGIFNIEGGCYAKAIDLTREKEPDIYDAIRFGTVLENVVIDPRTHEVDYSDSSITENTRASYPLEFIDNAVLPAVGPHPKNIILLCCDAFGVIPPVSKLTPEQAMYHFVSGYTSKVAGTEMGIVEPQATFSACYGSAFLMWHPMKYADMLAQKMAENGTTCWLVNTGWNGGKYGVGERISLKHTRAIIDAIHNDSFEDVEFAETPEFHLSAPLTCPGVPPEILNPAAQWLDQEEFFDTLSHLSELFVENFRKYTEDPKYTTEATRILSGGPQPKQWWLAESHGETLPHGAESDQN